MIKKVYWIINQYSSTPETSMGGRHYYLAQELAKKGHQVYVISGAYSHLLRHPKQFEADFLVERIIPGFDFVWVKLPKYDGAHSKERIINEFKFSWKIRKLKDTLSDKPDVVIYSSPALIGYFGASYLAKIFQVPFVFEVRDPWPLTLVELGGYSKNHPFIRLLQWIEDKAYQRADFVFANFFNAVEHMQSRGMDGSKFHWLPNGVSLYEVENKQSLSKEIASEIPKNKFIVGYIGTIGVANALNYLIDAAQLVADIPDIYFLVVGDGKEKENLIKLVRLKGLNNIKFISAIPKIQVQSMLEYFDVCYIGWHKRKMYRFGVAANKLPEYLYSRKPIIHSFSGAGDFVQQANAGITVEAENPVEIARAIREMFQLSKEERLFLGQNGHTFVLEHLDYVRLAERLEQIIFENNEIVQKE